MSTIMDDFLRPFTPQQVSNLLTLALEMDRFGLSPADVIHGCRGYFDNMVGETKQPPIESGPRIESSAVCPLCGWQLKISRVNASKCTNVGGPWKTSVECGNAECRYTDLSMKSVMEWRQNHVV